jgi:hypothetical protein
LTVGWELVHVAIDDHSRLAYARCCPIRRRRPQSASCAGRSASTGATGSRSSGC